ncbi:hypothetical protein [Helicobacter cinaedi]|uniref:hypothetical protein n=20 Tax=Helicobacter cinaedi TaxID=213 RepID=UPI000DA20B26|nr:hypothetical protein [Helicobacter cinaedi]BBB20312.1 hypothetical protein HC081234_14890 [Helicobacter cinaedi]BBB20415.1 hypothetical protein HC081234_15920 [Helicobacter cinaedi]
MAKTKNIYLQSNLHRREALKYLRDLGLLGVAGSFGIYTYQKKSLDSTLESSIIESLQDFIPYSTHTITNPLFSSNIPQEILSLPLKHFSIPHEYASILQFHKKQERNVNFIIPLTTSQYLDTTHYYLNMPMPHKNLPFLSYHYDSLQSFLKDLESQSFSMRNYTMDSINIQILKEFFMILEQDKFYKDKESRNPNNKDNDTNAPTSAIDSYHIAMNYLDDVYNDCFNTNLKDNTPNLQKHREFLRALNIIGENNIKAMYVGVGEKNNEEQNPNSSRVTSKRREKASKNIANTENDENKRPKFIGRLATTIIMKDGLYIG